MKILYVHGFGSRFDPEHEKVKQLEQLGKVYGVDVEFCKGYENVFKTVSWSVEEHEIDLIIGTSMGGYIAAFVSEKYDIPFVAFNPITQPSKTLERWLGSFTDREGRDHYLSDNIVEKYPDMSMEGNGIVISEMGDDIVSAHKTESIVEDSYEFHKFTGGSHCFDHIEKAVPLIQNFLKK